MKYSVKMLPLSFLVFLACSDDTEDLDPNDAGVHPDAITDAGTPDSGVEPDAGFVDTGPPPARILERRGLLGASSMKNRMIDPNFDLSATAWMPYTKRNPDYGIVQLRHYAQAPTDQPVLYMPKRPVNPEEMVLVGAGRGGNGVLEASVWIGRAIGDEAVEMQVSLVGVGPDASQGVAVDLQPDLNTRTKIDDLWWTEYTGSMTGSPVGTIDLVITDESDLAPFYVTGPHVLLTQRRVLGLQPLMRPLNNLERAVVGAHLARMRDSLGQARRTVGPFRSILP